MGQNCLFMWNRAAANRITASVSDFFRIFITADFLLFRMLHKIAKNPRRKAAAPFADKKPAKQGAARVCGTFSVWREFVKEITFRHI